MVDNSSEPIISPYLSDEVDLPKRTPFHAMWEIIKIRSWRLFGHHPACSRYENHYFKIGGLTFCIGCSSIYSAIILYAILFFSVPIVFRYNPYVVSILPFAGFGLAIVHLIARFKNKWIKAFFRFVAGFGIAAYFSLVILTPKWWLRIALTAILLAGNQMYGASRGPNANQKECLDCPLAKSDPPCRPIHITNVKVRKIYRIIEEEADKSRFKNKTKAPIIPTVDQNIEVNSSESGESQKI